MTAFQAWDVLCCSKKGLTPYLQCMKVFQGCDIMTPLQGWKDSLIKKKARDITLALNMSAFQACDVFIMLLKKGTHTLSSVYVGLPGLK